MKSSLKFKPISMDNDSSVTRFNLSVDGAELDIVCRTPNEKVIAKYRRGEARFALFEYQGVLFFLSKFGDEGWQDAPFHAALYPQQMAGFPSEFVPGQHHLFLAVRLRDADSDATYGARLVTLSKAMSAQLAKTVRGQLAKPISQQAIDVRIQRAFAQFSASQMARMALVRCHGGVSDDAANEPDLANSPHEEVEKVAVVQEFAHISLHSGHECTQRHEMVGQPAVALLSDLIEDARSKSSGWAELKLPDKDYPVQITIDGSNLTCRLCLPHFDGEKTPRTVVLFAVALDAAKGHDCWRAVHAAAGPAAITGAKPPPTHSWIAAMPMHEELLNLTLLGRNPALLIEILEMIQWAGDFERSMAFAFAQWFSRH